MTQTSGIELRGAGGEPVDLARTLLSHGVADLPPNVVAEDGSRLDTVLPAAGGVWTATLTREGLTVADRAPLAALAAQVRGMLRLDEDLSVFYARAADDAELAWAAAGAGRLLRSPTVRRDIDPESDPEA